MAKSIKPTQRTQHTIIYYLQTHRVGRFYPHVVLTPVKTAVKTGLGKTPKTHMRWVKLGKTNVLNSKNITVQTRSTG